MLGVWVNFAVVVLGGALGSIMKTAIPERYARTINNGLALCVIMIGISGALETQSTLLVIVSMVVGTVAGTALKIEERLGQLGDWAQKRFSHGGSRFSEGFVNATLLFGVGAMAVVGSLEAGLSNKPDTLLAKSALDGVFALIFASTFGPGVRPPCRSHCTRAASLCWPARLSRISRKNSSAKCRQWGACSFLRWD